MNESELRNKALEILEDFQKWLEEESVKTKMSESDLQAFIKQALQ